MLLYTVHFNLSLLFYREFMSSYNLCLLLESLLVQSAGVPRSLKSMHVLRIQVLRRPLDMVICERGHEVVAVVVVRLQAELDALVVACLLCCLEEVLWQELLLLVEVVAGALNIVSMSWDSRVWNTYNVDEDFKRPLPLLDKLCSIVLLPFLLVVADVTLECLLPPWCVDGVGNGCESRNRLVLPRVLQEQCQSTVSSHAVTCDANLAGVELLKLREESLGKLFGDVRVHVVALGPWLLSRIDVETGTRPEVVGLVLALDVQTPWSASQSGTQPSMASNALGDVSG